MVCKWLQAVPVAGRTLLLLSIGAFAATTAGVGGIGVWPDQAALAARAEADSKAERSRTYARWILQDALDKSRQLDGYKTLFYFRERTGLFSTLDPWSKVEATYRRQPRSIKMVWLNKDSDYAESVYVEGRDDDQLRVLPRKGLLGMRPSVTAIDPQTAVTLGKTLRPITDFGLAELISTTFEEIDQARQVGRVRMWYAGRSSPPHMDQQARKVVIQFPEEYEDGVREDIYISTETGYPIAAYFWEPDGDLLAAYLYGEPDPTLPPMSAFWLSRDR